jgi:solute carrier family 25 S-adenosylmethionine transporter 26
LTLYPIDTIKTRLQEKKNFNKGKLFSSLYSGVGSVLIGSGPSSALFFTAYNLTKETIHFSSQWKTHIIAATFGEFVF